MKFSSWLRHSKGKEAIWYSALDVLATVAVKEITGFKEHRTLPHSKIPLDHPIAIKWRNWVRGLGLEGTDWPNP